MNTCEVVSQLRCSGGKRVSKIKNSFTAVCHNRKRTKVSIGSRWAQFLIFQLCFILFSPHLPAWAGLSSLTVDANGDAVFNGEADGELLTISFTTSDFDSLGTGDPQYTYRILVDSLGEKTIALGPGTGNVLSKNQTVRFVWDGTYFKQGDTGPREKLQDGDYTLTVRLENADGTSLPLEQTAERTATVTLDTQAPEVTISIDDTAFSPNLYALPVYYDINEDVDEAWLAFQRAPGNANIGRRVPLATTAGSHSYDWYGDDTTGRTFLDGQYTLRIQVQDKGGNTAETGKTGNITIDTEAPRITNITLNNTIPLTNGTYVNAPITTLQFTADDPDGTGIDLTGRDTEVRIRPIDSTQNLPGTLTFGTTATFTLSDALDALEENGAYEVTAFIADTVGNLASHRVRFTFDNTAPLLKSVAADTGEITAGSGIRGTTHYVEATFTDNTALHLAASTIRLKGPSGSDLLGQQTRPADGTIRWQLLYPLVAENGRHDGQYTVHITGADKAGNTTPPIQLTFRYDNLAPELVSIQPTRDGDPFNILGDTIYYNRPLHQFVATFDDGTFGTGVAFADTTPTTHIAFGTPNTDGTLNSSTGRAFPDKNNNVLTYIMDTPILTRDGSQDGTYRLDIVATDPLGNTQTYNFQLIYDTQVPTVVTTTPAANETVNDLSHVVIKLNETTSGIDFVQSTFTLKHILSENEVQVPVDIASNGTDTATLTLRHPIALDGSDDGTYRIEVTPTDNAGNVGAVVRREFYLVRQAHPYIRLITPDTPTVNSLNTITVELVDYIGTGIHVDGSTITVQDAHGQTVPHTKVVADTATHRLTWHTEKTLPKGTADGTYTITATFHDYIGNIITQTFPLHLDTQFPEIIDVHLGTATETPLPLDSTTVAVTESFSHIRIAFDAPDVDLDTTTATLTAPDGTAIATRKSIDTTAALILHFQNLAQLGTYTLTLTPSDTFQNTAEAPFHYNFTLDIAVPVVTTVHIGGQSGAQVYVNGTAATITATLADTTDSGIAIGHNGSTIVVTNDNGLPVPGDITHTDENQLIWTPTVLPTDGSADGRYTVAITPVDTAGRTGDTAYRTFIYDTQAPHITASAPTTEHQPISYLGDSLTQFQFTVTDIGPALLNLDDQTIQLRKENGEVVPGLITHDDINQLFFTLATPLPTDGSADGTYILTIHLIDKAGNPYHAQRTLVYDTQTPQIASATVNTAAPQTLTPYHVTDLSEAPSNITLTFNEMTRIDFENTQITLMGPDGSTIPLTLENNGTDTLTASFISLTQSGLYTLAVTPQDIAGNTTQGTVPYPFRLTLAVPKLTSVLANGITYIYPLTAYEITQITDVIHSLTIEFTDAAHIDFQNTQITLTAPTGQEVPLTQIDNRQTPQFTVQFVPLTQSGHYTLAITPQDIAGNTAHDTIQYPFRLDITRPAVSTVQIDGHSSTNVLTNNPNTEIIATFADTTSVGLAFGDDGSTITVQNAQGLTVPGTTTTNGTDQLTWTPTVLPTDGSTDGRYTVTIRPIDIAGRTGTVVHRHFIYDTQTPRITHSTPLTRYQPISYINAHITQFQWTLEDIGPASLALADQTIELKNATGETVPGLTTHDNVNQLFFTLATPLPTDGSADGTYTLTIHLIDKAGNTDQTTYTLYYDSQVPQLTSVSLNTEPPTHLTPYHVTDIAADTINKLTITFGETTYVDFAATTIALTGPDNAPIPLTFENNGTDTLTASFISLTHSGHYTLAITPQDIAGNAAQGAVSYPFRIKFTMPQVTSVIAHTENDPVTLAQHAIVTSTEFINRLTLTFTDPSQVDFENTNVQLSGPDAQAIPVTLETTDSSQLIVRFVPLEQSGLYTLLITPQDTAGNIAQHTTSYQFRLTLDIPTITSITAHTAETAITLTPYEILELAEPVDAFTVDWTDPARIDFERTQVVLTGPTGQQIPITLEDTDDTTLLVKFVPLTHSGHYTLAITSQDIYGNTPQHPSSYQFQLKIEVPHLTNVTANTQHTTVTLTQHDIVEISEVIESFTLNFTDAHQIDFENTDITLTNPTGQEIPITVENTQNTQLTVQFVPLTHSGHYTLAITPQDIAGNTAQTASYYPFRLDTTLPTVSSVRIDGKVGATVHVKNAVPTIIAHITNALGGGVSISDSGSTITVTNAQGIPVAGTTTTNATNQLIWTPIPLPTDGSTDGHYTAVITPVDKAGRTGTATQRHFIYDTQTPRITAATPITLHAPISYISSSINQFVLTVEDVGPADIRLTAQVIALMDATGKTLPAQMTHDALTKQLYLTLDTPFASDGTTDGPYTLHVLLIDKAGNRLDTQFHIVYDSIIPQVASVHANTAGTPIALTQNQVTPLSESIDTLTIQFNEATRVDFERTHIELLNPDDQAIPLTISHDGIGQATVQFNTLTHSGQYTLAITPQDIAGNAAHSPTHYTFNLEFILPDVASVLIGDTITLGSADTAYVHADNLVIAANLLDPANTGLSFDPITGSEIVVTTLDGIIVPGTITTNGTDLLVWQPITVSNDGSSDGRYAVYVYAVDKKGREANPAYREFIYDTQAPEITQATPIDLSQPVSYLSDSLTQFQFTLQDVGPADLILTDQNITLRQQNGTVVPAKLTHDTQNQLFLTLDTPLPLDGSHDGHYTVEITCTDKSGNVLAIQHLIIYDTQAPTLVSTLPADNALLTEDITQIQVHLNDPGESGIDWSQTTVTLIDPNGLTIPGELTSDGTSQLTLKTNQLVADGRYTIHIHAIDRAGNGTHVTHESDFLLSRQLPAVITTLPKTAPKDAAYTNETITEVEATLETIDTRHLSTLRLVNAEGHTIAGQQRRESAKLIYRLVRPLATDGSEDGTYTLEFTPISSSGRTGTTQNYTFTYDTQSPELNTTKDIHLIVAEQNVDNSLVSIRTDITDTPAGVDWENLQTDWVNFERIAPNPQNIDGTVSYLAAEAEEAAPEQLIFTLHVPLADDGSADGTYKITVTPIDKAGNGDQTYEKMFTYDTRPPVIDPNTLTINDTPLLIDIDSDAYPSAVSTTGGVVIQAKMTDTGLGINLSHSRITVQNPNGHTLPGTTRQNGIDTLIFTSDGLNVEGIYHATITATGNDTERLGITPQGTLTTTFLYETTEPTATVTDDGGKTELTDEPLPLQGTAQDPQGTRSTGQQGENEIPVPASGVRLVEIVGTGPDGQPITPVPATDDSDAQQTPWSKWKVDFLPTRSGQYDLDIQVTDNAGNTAVYDYGTVTMSVSFTFRGDTFAWPNPLRHTNNDVGFFSYHLNTSDATVQMTLYIYDWGGDMVYTKTYNKITPEHRNGNEVRWQLKNNAGNRVARGIYVFRLEAIDAAGNTANAIGKILVVD